MNKLTIRELDKNRANLETAKRIQELVYEDTLRLGAREKTARTVANPESETMVRAQLQRINNPSIPGTTYAGLYIGSQMEGIAKVGPWLPGDERPFGRMREVRARAAQLVTPLEALPRGLHIFAVEKGLALAALMSVRGELIPREASLKAAVHVDDDELRGAFDELGALKDHPRASLTLGAFTASYVLHELPSINTSRNS